MAKKKEKPSIENALTMLKKKNWHKAMDIAMKILDDDPNASQALFVAGVAQAYVGCYGKAQELLNEAIEHDPKNFEAWFYLGRSYDQTWKHDEAAKCFKKALELKPDDEESLMEFALSSRKANNMQDSIHAFFKLTDFMNFKADAEKNLKELGFKSNMNKSKNNSKIILPKKALNEMLVKAAYQKDLEKVKYALDNGANVNAKSSQGRTALLETCDHTGSIEISEYLIDHGADINLSQKDRETPLTYACMYGKLEQVKLLLSKGADPNKKGGYGRTPLHFSATGGTWTEHYAEITELLLEYGADPNLYHDGGDTPLLEATWSEDFTPELAKILIKHGADIGLKSKPYHDTPLERASEKGRMDIVQILESASKTRDPKSLKEDIIHSLLDAIRNKKKDVVMYLLKENVELLDKKFYMGDFLEYVIRYGYSDILNYLEQIGVNLAKDKDRMNELLMDAAYENKLDMVKYLIDLGADVDGGGYGARENPLMKAARHNSIELAKFLLEKGANIEAKDYRGNSPLHFAAWEGKLEMIEFLLKNGADIDSTNNLNWTSLMQAALTGHLHLVKLLLDKGASINEIDKEKGASILILAANGGSYECVRLLLEHGADKNLKDNEGKTAVDHAREKGYINIVNLIESN